MSKRIAYLLRHGLQEVGKDGFVDISILENRSLMKRVHIEDIVRNDPKGRYEISGEKIRAVQGHSLPQVETEALASLIEEWNGDPPFHKTQKKNLDSIRIAGLHPMGRRHVHFARDPMMLRKRCNCTLAFDLKSWIQNGYKAYMAKNCVILVPEIVPWSYLEVVVL
jgi:putative RNA 2'-phosphotransferase